MEGCILFVVIIKIFLLRQVLFKHVYLKLKMTRLKKEKTTFLANFTLNTSQSLNYLPLNILQKSAFECIYIMENAYSTKCMIIALVVVNGHLYVYHG